MHDHSNLDGCPTRRQASSHRRERGVRAVVALTATMMVLEIAVGYVAGSMALLADGWHMATHVAALGMASLAYVLARRLESHRAFTFGTGKIHTLAGYTSALLLALVAIAMIVESATRLVEPRTIDVASSLPVAIVGLLVNIASVKLLHVDDEHDHDGDDHHEHDHNHRAAVMHVMADILTSALAIVALVAAQLLGWTWLDPITGIVGGLVIGKWSFGLCKTSSFELLDVDPSVSLQLQIREALEQIDDVRVHDLHVWSLGRGARSCVVTVTSATPRDPAEYRRRILEVCALSHLTVEVQRCAGEHSHDASSDGHA
ncbi:MAG: CDF family Co(II)/Ni(II) efflux transporter DmeF [Deltaproteobacteria bacterium]|nr:CDF family Co(II)/Ni(II) efflux transporter DmeF [Nannocystaceae bacterium]